MAPAEGSLGSRVKWSGLQLHSWRQGPFSPETGYFKVTQSKKVLHTLQVFVFYPVLSLTKAYSEKLAQVVKEILSKFQTQTDKCGWLQIWQPKGTHEPAADKGKQALLSPTALTKTQTPNS